ncbi:RpiB/LacA/LacB family sugar-phosphate isomerase [Legionella sp. D16C41]|uniref:RpiB/LacA/LacB family sugar-phosphate isomerase n=1 Tax=Legionella sp. D16C41 TaxID=3402688 RepID=UPI003AF43817
MKIAVCSDEHYSVNDFVVQELERLGHKAILFGSIKSHKDESWVEATKEAAEAIKNGLCTEGIFFCWTGTGASIVANKVASIRAALCTDAQTAKGARLWNNANVLVLSNRLLTRDLAKEILAAWFDSATLSKRNEDITSEIKKIEELNFSRKT